MDDDERHPSAYISRKEDISINEIIIINNSNIGT